MSTPTPLKYAPVNLPKPFKEAPTIFPAVDNALLLGPLLIEVSVSIRSEGRLLVSGKSARDLEDDDVVVVESADAVRDIGGFGERLDVYSLYGLYSISPVDLSIADPVLVEADIMPVTGSQRRFSICIGLMVLLA